MTRTFSRRLSLAVTTAALLLASCGPFGYLKKVAKDATKAVADAKAAGAEQYAPYEYWGAVTYLEQAKVLMAYSEYERSFDYGVRAKQLAEEAKKKSDRREAGEMSETLEGEEGEEGTPADPPDEPAEDGEEEEGDGE
jgi:glucose-6-phosphate isomerase